MLANRASARYRVPGGNRNNHVLRDIATDFHPMVEEQVLIIVALEVDSKSRGLQAIRLAFANGR